MKSGENIQKKNSFTKVKEKRKGSLSINAEITESDYDQVYIYRDELSLNIKPFDFRMVLNL